jgi:hypothetical protein
VIEEDEPNDQVHTSPEVEPDTEQEPGLSERGSYREIVARFEAAGRYGPGQWRHASWVPARRRDPRRP